MAGYGTLLYVVDSVAVAKIEAGGGYATPTVVTAENIFEIEANIDTDSFMSKGRRRSMIAVITHGTGKVNQGVFDLPTIAQMTHASESETGTTPNRSTNFDIEMGDDLPEFGIICNMKSEDGAGGRFGMGRCKLTKFPFWKGEQNKIVVPELEFDFWSLSDTVAKAIWINIDETLTALPSTSSAFDTFFGVS